MPATSEPAPGSVTPTAVMVLPARMPGRYFSSWRLVPKRTRCGLAMSVWTSTVMAKPPCVERPTSSASTTEARASSARPAHRLGHAQGEEAELAHFAQHLARHEACLLPCRPVRLH